MLTIAEGSGLQCKGSWVFHCAGRQQQPVAPVLSSMRLAGTHAVLTELAYGLWLWLCAVFLQPQVYYFSKFQVKVANKQYATVRNDYELHFDNRCAACNCCNAQLL